MNKTEKTRKEELFEEFPPVSKEEWEAVINEDLGGKDYRERLKWDTGEGLEVLPFYHREDLERERTGTVSAGDGSKNDWKVIQPVYDRDPAGANRAARKLLEKGADGVAIKIDLHRTQGALGGDLEGIDIQSQKDLSVLMDKISLENTMLKFDCGMAAPAFLAMYHNELESRDTDPDKAVAHFLYDPFAFTARNGYLPKPQELFVHDATSMLAFASDHLPGSRVLGLDARIWHNAGSTIVQELGFALAAASEWLALLSGNDVAIDRAASDLHLTFSVGSNYFLEIAKIRAARLLWPQLLNAYGLDSRQQNDRTLYIHAESSEWNKTIFDPYANLIRASTEAMAAVIGGCDSLTLHPHDRFYNQPDAFSKRIARNTHLILKEEAKMDQVADPAAGSYYIEKLTNEFARRAWEQFQEVEQQGGLMESLKNGFIQTSIGESRKEKQRRVATRERIFVGTNKYPNPDERKSDELQESYSVTSLRESVKEFEIDTGHLIQSISEAFGDGATLMDVIPVLYDITKQDYPSLEPYRGARPFEELRLATEKSPKTPKVLLLPVGDRKMRSARATFAANFFGCAGYRIENPIGFESAEDAIEKARESKPEVAVICSSDEEYRDIVEPICEALLELKQPPIMVVAGHPEEDIDRYRDAGIEAFIHARSDLLQTLTDFQKKLGISE